ncbi:hypothetical protein BH09BAC4_BH09BAC4_44170 [soil metagenome]
MKGWMVCSSEYFFYEDEEDLKIYDFEFRSGAPKSDVKTIINDPAVLSNYGSSFRNLILESSYFINNSQFESREDIINKSAASHRFWEDILFFTWFAKDNSARATILTAYLYDTDTAIEMYPTEGFFNADGTNHKVVFNRHEFMFAFEVFNKFESLTQNKSKVSSDLSVPKSTGFSSFSYKSNYKELNRIDRAIRFLRLARAENELSIKIAHYVLVIECLFSANDGMEIAHKLAERVANYIGQSQAESLSIFQEFKKYYNIRSKYIHGEKGTNASEADLIQLSVTLDNLVRSVLTKVIMEDSKIFLLDSTAQGDWFTSKLFK